MSEIVLSGIRSTGNLHLGNYLGAVKNFVKMQHTSDCFFFIADKDFDYKTKTEQNLEDLIAASKDEKYYEDAKNELDILAEKFAHDKIKDLRLFKDEIKEQITQEIVIKYYFEKGAMLYGLKTDKEVLKAVELLKNEQEYNSILQSKN